jgi:TRAP-type mannitol/chloroaromatic compound transport system permease large subunit
MGFAISEPGNEKWLKRLVRSIQGDQIGRIFAYWAVVFFWQFFITTAALFFVVSLARQLKRKQ